MVELIFVVCKSFSCNNTATFSVLFLFDIYSMVCLLPT